MSSQFLDNLAFALALAHQHPRQLERSEEDGISFPIRSDAIPRHACAISLMSDPAKDVIIALAPDPGRKPLTLDLLWLLNETATRDRHHTLRLMATARVKNVFVDGAVFPMRSRPRRVGSTCAPSPYSSIGGTLREPSRGP